jgi:phosphoglycerate dehydrogenase-like enzyme
MAMLMLARRFFDYQHLRSKNLGRSARARRRAPRACRHDVGIVGVGEIGSRLAKDRAQRASA